MNQQNRPQELEWFHSHLFSAFGVVSLLSSIRNFLAIFSELFLNENRRVVTNDRRLVICTILQNVFGTLVMIEHGYKID